MVYKDYGNEEEQKLGDLLQRLSEGEEETNVQVKNIFYSLYLVKKLKHHLCENAVTIFILHFILYEDLHVYSGVCV